MNPQERLTLLGTRIRKYDIGEDELLRELESQYRNLL
jgi:hypothetical protein